MHILLHHFKFSFRFVTKLKLIIFYFSSVIMVYFCLKINSSIGVITSFLYLLSFLDFEKTYKPVYIDYECFLFIPKSFLYKFSYLFLMELVGLKGLITLIYLILALCYYETHLFGILILIYLSRQCVLVHLSYYSARYTAFKYIFRVFISLTSVVPLLLFSNIPASLGFANASNLSNILSIDNIIAKNSISIIQYLAFIFPISLVLSYKLLQIQIYHKPFTLINFEK